MTVTETESRPFINILAVGGPMGGEEVPCPWPPPIVFNGEGSSRMGDGCPEEGLYHLTTSFSQMYDVAWVGPWSSKEDVLKALVGLAPLLYHWGPVIRNKDTKGITVFTGKASEDEIRKLIAERPS